MLSWRQAFKLTPIVFVVALAGGLLAFNSSDTPEDVQGTPATVKKNDVPSITAGKRHKAARQSVPEDTEEVMTPKSKASGGSSESAGQLTRGYVVSKMPKTDLKQFSMLGVTLKSGLDRKYVL